MSRQEPIKAMLTGGNPRALARTEEVVTLVLGNRTRLQELYACLLEEDEIVRMRASDALEKVCRGRPAWLQAYVPRGVAFRGGTPKVLANRCMSTFLFTTW
jgi:hypothetical protein